MFIEVLKREGMEAFQLQELRNVVKTGGEVMTRFRDKYKELRIETGRKKTVDSYYMGRQSKSRERYQNSRIRRDFHGRDYYHDGRGRNDSRGRSYLRRYYRN